jgi:hypothetical protein
MLFLFQEICPMKRLTQVFIIALTLLLSIAFPVLAGAIFPADSPPVVVPESVLLLIPVIVGSLGIPIINWLKKIFNFTGDQAKVKNTWLSFCVSFVLAVFALAITNSLTPLTGPETVILWVSMAFSTATLIYKSVEITTP